MSKMTQRSDVTYHGETVGYKLVILIRKLILTPKKAEKANEGHQGPELHNSLISSIFNVKSSMNVILRKSCKFSFLLH